MLPGECCNLPHAVIEKQRVESGRKQDLAVTDLRSLDLVADLPARKAIEEHARLGEAFIVPLRHRAELEAEFDFGITQTVL